MSEQNVKLIQGVYESYLRGDVPAVLSQFAEPLEFTVPGAPEIPYAGTRRSAAELGSFFKELDEKIVMTSFEPKQYIASGDTVVTLGNYKGYVRSNNKTYDVDWAMVWTLRDGKIHSFREYMDPTSIKNAFAGK